MNLKYCSNGVWQWERNVTEVTSEVSCVLLPFIHSCLIIVETADLLGIKCTTIPMYYK